MPMHPETLFAHVGVSERDCDALLNGFPPGHRFHVPHHAVIGYEETLPVTRFEDHEILAHLMHRAGLFPSVGAARKNGWNKPIEPGFRLYVVGKGKHRVYVLGPMPE